MRRPFGGRRFSYANVVSTIALVAALATGGAYAAGKIGSNDIAKNAIRSKHVLDHSLRAADLPKVKAIGIKPNPVTADDPCVAGPGSTPVQVRTFCGTEQLHVGGPPHWYDGTTYAPTTFYRSDGIVHLSGSPRTAGADPGPTILVLPDGYRPAGLLAFETACDTQGPPDYGECQITVDADGRVAWTGGTFYGANGGDAGVHLDGMTFLAK